MSTTEISFTKACKNFFGQKPGQPLQAFAKELQEIPADDKAELAALLGAELGTVVTVSPAKA